MTEPWGGDQALLDDAPERHVDGEDEEDEEDDSAADEAKKYQKAWINEFNS